MSRDDALLYDIAGACRRIGRFVEGVDESGFSENAEKHWAVVSQLLIIGEATKQLSAEMRGRLRDVPWSDIARMRDKMIHHYSQIDLGEVWRAATLDVPRLLIVVEPLLPPAE